MFYSLNIIEINFEFWQPCAARGILFLEILLANSSLDYLQMHWEMFLHIPFNYIGKGGCMGMLLQQIHIEIDRSYWNS